GRSLTTTAPAPTTVFSPTLTPGQTITPPPSQTFVGDGDGLGRLPLGPAGLRFQRVGRGQELNIGADLYVVADPDGGHVEQDHPDVDEGPRPDMDLVAVVAVQRRADLGALPHRAQQLAQQ